MKKFIRILVLLVCIAVLVYNANYLYNWAKENNAAKAEQDEAFTLFDADANEELDIENEELNAEEEMEKLDEEIAKLEKELESLKKDKSNPKNKARIAEIKAKLSQLKNKKTELNKKISTLRKKTTELKAKNLAKVQKKYKNVVGFIKVTGTNIKYFVTQYRNNTYYLTHSLNGAYNSAGNPFLDYRNSLDDQALVIYGHNRLDKSQFGSLKNVQNKPNTKITFTTNQYTHEYKIFSTYIIKNESFFNRVSFNNNYDLFLKTITKRSKYKYGVKVGKNDKILTLSTCYGASRLNNRLVVHSKMIK